MRGRPQEDIAPAIAQSFRVRAGSAVIVSTPVWQRTRFSVG